MSSYLLKNEETTNDTKTDPKSDYPKVNLKTDANFPIKILDGMIEIEQ
jgi:hypothetical protein